MAQTTDGKPNRERIDGVREEKALSSDVEVAPPNDWEVGVLESGSVVVSSSINSGFALPMGGPNTA